MRGYVIFKVVVLVILFQNHKCMAQQMWRYEPENPVICHYRSGNRPNHVPVSDKFRSARMAGDARVKTATIAVEYINFTGDIRAKDALQYAIEIWESELTSAIPIRLRAEWTELDPGVLAQSIWGSAYANFGGEQHMNTFYPVALAEKISGRELNDALEPDIVVSFNKNISWYFATDGITPNGKMDLVTIALHEIAHGLGFTDTYTVNGADGSVGLATDSDSVPFIFDLFVEDNARKSLFHNFGSPSSPLASALQSTNVFFNGSMSAVALNGMRPELYAPATFDKGSSISHLDESAFADVKDPNRLMTPHISGAESIHDPGSVLRGIFSDMGWINTRIDHQPWKDTERKDGQPYVVAAKIQSDNGYDPAEVKLHYSTDGANFITSRMIATGTPDQFRSSLPGTTGNRTYAYYISVVDDLNRVFTSPGKTQLQGKPSEQGTHYFNIGPDEASPEIIHIPVTFISEDDPTLELKAEVSDNQGVGEVLLEYLLNDGQVQTVVMDGIQGTEQYGATIAFPPLVIGDILEYRILATDIANQQNPAFLPAQGFFKVLVTGIMPPRDSYTNDFNTGVASDFFGKNFSIATPDRFENPAIHSDHPYENGPDIADENSHTYQLQIPIRINENNPFIRFDEIVLVEPGEKGSEFGDNDFYDYAVVEGSVDRGESWEPFTAGYDCREDAAWVLRYNEDTGGGDSQGEGDPALYRKRTIDMLENGKFKPDDEVLIRFRIFADKFRRGWGWAVDNLSIQSPVTNAEQPLSEVFQVYPVPVRDELSIALNVPATSVKIEICDLQGRTVLSETFTPGGEVVSRTSIDVQRLHDGAYILKAVASNRIYRRKFLKVR